MHTGEWGSDEVVEECEGHRIGEQHEECGESGAAATSSASAKSTRLHPPSRQEALVG